ncbi:MAG: type II secretion system protein GspM [Nitrospinota bacterium]|nr:type II secretion system protein GspM [Nitrospinota bacterium]
MIKYLSAREQRALIVGGICVVIYMIFVFGVKPVYLQQKKIEEQIQNKIFFIKKYHEILNQKAYYKQKGKANKAIQIKLARQFLGNKKPALAAASLQKTLERYAKQTSVNIESARIEKPRYTERLLTVPVEINIRSTLNNLTQFIYLIENHEKFMVVEEVAIRRINKSDPEELQTRLLVLGFIRKLETT